MQKRFTERQIIGALKMHEACGWGQLNQLWEQVCRKIAKISPAHV